MRWSFLRLVPAQHWPALREAVTRLARDYRLASDDRPSAIVVGFSGQGEPRRAPVRRPLDETAYASLRPAPGTLLVVAEFDRPTGGKADTSIEFYPRAGDPR
jgi:hypothetical protein